jgi:excisionase family DNA binding protein
VSIEPRRDERVITVVVDADALASAVAEKLLPLVNAGATPWMTKKEAAEYLRMGLASLENLIRVNAIPYIRFEEPRKILFDRRALDEWVVESHRSRP